MLANRKRLFGEILISEGLIDKEQLEQALEVQRETGESLGSVLVRMGAISDNEVVRTLCIQYQLPFIRPTAYDIENEMLKHLTPDFMYQHRLVPLDRIGSCTIVAIAEIPSDEAQAQLAKVFGDEIYFFLAALSEVEGLLRTKFSLGQEQILQIDGRRRGHGHGKHAGGKAAGGAQGGAGLTASSWEAIFDEAERNLSSGS